LECGFQGEHLSKKLGTTLIYKLLPDIPKVPDAPLAQVTFGVEPFQSMMEEALNC
jgi:hypothetical protein